MIIQPLHYISERFDLDMLLANLEPKPPYLGILYPLTQAIIWRLHILFSYESGKGTFVLTSKNDVFKIDLNFIRVSLLILIYVGGKTKNRVGL